MKSVAPFRSYCPVSSSLDLLGDKWTLLIVRDILFLRKTTFKEFSSSQEHIASNILSSRLAKLEELEIISKQKDANNRKRNIYTITQKGILLLPVLLELAFWFYKTSTEEIPL